MAQQRENGGESTFTVLVALAVNFGIGVMKAFAGVVTGSAALLAEAAHSVADTFTEGLLLTALRRSGRPADRRHPFGYGKERYFWSLLAAVSIFVSGALFAFIEGFETLAGENTEQTSAWVGYLVLGLAFAMELVSWTQAVRQVRRDAAEDERSFTEYLRVSDDPTVKTVFLEDTAALIGLVIAFAGVGLHDLTGSAMWDGVASLLIGVLLVVVAYVLGRSNKALLIGRQADVRLVREVHSRLLAQPEVEAVADLLTMLTGTDQVLLCARVDFVDSLTAAELERACVRIDAELRAGISELDEIFLEPVPRTDPELRARVLARYGDLARRFDRD
ncbi:cation diffusion facilitator family transporter [Allokutzneria sp. A3M-2-11 16]|uniref:cation diffusion facilitator family transporter n=1 Tax=Allokutzneria sp. A3M-2-11 16 TaxID=2962043 RepID=UPI0020B8AB40|nr:cation diffusion facilitator family transporter [Allokutzneria sp. A3M-2-11 16]MCP3799269.1 cation diffusion facilitator family transporter [Allokutzneria sp. A3M-2-11 16]